MFVVDNTPPIQCGARARQRRLREETGFLSGIHLVPLWDVYAGGAGITSIFYDGRRISARFRAGRGMTDSLILVFGTGGILLMAAYAALCEWV